MTEPSKHALLADMIDRLADLRAAVAPDSNGDPRVDYVAIAEITRRQACDQERCAIALTELRAENEQLKAELAEVERDYDEVSDLCENHAACIVEQKEAKDALRFDRDAALSLEARLREALAEFGSHSSSCHIFRAKANDGGQFLYMGDDGWKPGPAPCTCGLSAALART